MYHKKIKIIELAKAPSEKVGIINKNGVDPEIYEEKTFRYLTLFGLNVELIKPNVTKRARNPDVLIMGTIWEVKTPTSSNRNTIKKRFREATKQADRIIFDLRFINGDADTVEKQILELFKGGGKIRRMMVVDKNGKLLDYYK